MKPLDAEHILRARNGLAEEGLEMTPDELLADMLLALDAIRRGMRAEGLAAPESDEEMFLLLNAAMTGREWPRRIRE